MPDIDPIVAATADVDPRATIGAGTRVWHLAQVREDARVGEDCIVGRGAYIGPGVVVGDRCKIQNHALVYEPAVLEDGAFVGPAVVFTNDYYPRAVNPDGTLKSRRRLARGRRDGPHGRVDRRAVGVRRPRDHRPLGARRGRLRGDQGRPRLRARRRGARAAHPLGGPRGRAARARRRRAWVCPTTGERYEEHGGELRLAQ